MKTTNYEISQKNSVSEIIYRDGKQFFMPEVENANF